MQTDLEPIASASRLWWDGRRGVAVQGGVSVELGQPPQIGVPHLRELDYMPSRRVAMVRESAERWRDMTPDERSAAQALLERIHHAAQEAAHG